MLSETPTPLASDEASSETLDKTDPTDIDLYRRLASAGVLAILWEFVRQDHEYRDAFAAFARAGNAATADEAMRIALHFGLRELLPPNITPLPKNEFMLPLLPSALDKDRNRVTITFDDSVDCVLQMHVACWMLLRHRQGREKRSLYPRRTQQYSNARLAFLVRVLHCAASGMSAADSAILLSEMRQQLSDEKQTGRKRVSETYSAKHYKADLKAAKSICGQRLRQLMHEARVSCYVEPGKPWPL